MSNLKILSATTHSKLSKIYSMEIVLNADHSKKLENHATIIVKGYNDSEKDSIEIMLSYDNVVTFKDLSELLSEVLCYGNSYDNVTGFHPDFWNYEINEMLNSIHNNTSLPKIEKEDFGLLNLTQLSTLMYGRVTLATSNKSYGTYDRWDDKFDYIDNFFLELQEKKAYIRTSSLGEWQLANIDHDALYEYYVKNDELAKIITESLPNLNLKPRDILKSNS